MAGQVTISGGGLAISFTPNGQDGTRYSEILAAAVNKLLAPTSVGGGGESVTPLNVDGSPTRQGNGSDVPVYLLMADSVQGGTQSYAVPEAGYVIDTISGAVSVDGATQGHDSILVLNNQKSTIQTYGSDNLVIFVNGDNLYNGSSDGSGDTVEGGSGNDTINTGTGATTVNSGTGSANIALNDKGPGYFNDYVWIDDGHNTVHANGAGDVVVTTTPGQTIDGAAGVLTIVMAPNGDHSLNGDNLVTAGSGYTTVLDETNANTIIGGTGDLTFIAGPGIDANVEIASGFAVIFGNNEASITLSSEFGAEGISFYVAGSGAETLAGAEDASPIIAFGSPSAAANDLIVTGSANDWLVAGHGNETLDGGAGKNVFLIDAAASSGASIVLGDFGDDVRDLVAFSGFQESEIQTALRNGNESGSNFVLSLPDEITVTFDNVSGASALEGHIIEF